MTWSAFLAASVTLRPRLLIILGIAFGTASTGQAQITDSISSWEAQFNVCIGPPAYTCESINELHQQLVNAYRAEDNLTGLTYLYWDRQNADYPDAELAISWLDSAKTERWREPKTTAEWEAVCWEEFTRGHHLLRQDDILNSLRAYERAEALYSEYLFESVDAVESIYKSLIGNYTRLGDNRKAILMAEVALSRLNRRTEVEGASGLLNNAGLAAWDAGDYHKADSLLEAGLRLPNLPALQAGLLFYSQARSFWDQGRETEAKWSLRMSERQFRRGTMADDYRSKELRANQWALTGEMATRSEDAKAAFEQSLQSIAAAYGQQEGRLAGKVNNQLAALAWEAAELELAASYFDRAIRCLQPSYHERLMGPVLADSLLFAENTLLEALDGKGQILAEMGFQKAALDQLEAAQRVAFLLHATYQFESERLRAQAANQERLVLALRLCYALKEEPVSSWIDQDHKPLHHDALALRWMEQSRAILLAEAMQAELHRSGNDRLDSLIQQRQALQRAFNFFDAADGPLPRKMELGRRLAELQAEIEALQPTAGRMGPDLDKSTLAVLRADTNQLILSYFLGPDQAYCYYAKGEDSGLLQIAYGAAQSQELTQFLALIGDRRAQIEEPELYQQKALALRQHWLPDVLPWRSAKNLIILADEHLHQLPFAALPIDAAATPLIRQLSIRRIYSLQIEGLPTNIDHESSAAEPFFFAPFINQGRDQWTALPYSEEEIDCSSGEYCLRDQQATVSALRQALGKYRILHLSTHAQASGGQASIECFDGSLSLAEIAQLRIPADLIILSACETNIGEFKAGEGVFSLARNFTYAGAQSLVASRWSVSDRSTAWIMQRFHQELNAGLSRAEALRQAQLAYLDRADLSPTERLPFHWAAFSMTGAGGSIFSTSAGFSLWWSLVLIPLLGFIFWKKG